MSTILQISKNTKMFGILKHIPKKMLLKGLRDEDTELDGVEIIK